jgi:hypothetical protein
MAPITLTPAFTFDPRGSFTMPAVTAPHPAPYTLTDPAPWWSHLTVLAVAQPSPLVSVPVVDLTCFCGVTIPASQVDDAAINVTRVGGDSANGYEAYHAACLPPLPVTTSYAVDFYDVDGKAAPNVPVVTDTAEIARLLDLAPKGSSVVVWVR